MRRATIGVFVAALVALLVLSMSVYTVDQRKAAIKFQLGEVIDVQTRPGLYFLVPFVQNVRLYDTRIQTMEPRDPERFLTSENRNVLVDSFVKEPYMLTLTAEKEDVDGIPASAFAGAPAARPRPRTPAKKK